VSNIAIGQREKIFANRIYEFAKRLSERLSAALTPAAEACSKSHNPPMKLEEVLAVRSGIG
jgi:hypothetical protein